MSGMRLRRILGVAVLLFCIQAFAASKSDSQTPAAASDYAVSNLCIPLLFETNSGQADPAISYLARAHGYTFLLKTAGPEVELSDGTRLALQFRGAPDLSRLQAHDPSPVRINYYRGRSSADWHTGISTFERVSYQHLYPGIDLQFYGNQRQLEHDFIVAPGSDPARIVFNLAGAKSQRIEAHGDLILTLAGGELRLKSPLAYQEKNGHREAVSSHYKLAADGSIGFEIGKYDRRRALVIDPILSLSTYLGGNGNDSLRGVAVFPGAAAPGWVFAAGVTNSTNLPATVGQTALKGAVNGYLARFNISTGALVWITYFGGSGSDYLNALATDSSGNAYIGGDTTSADLPLAGSSISTTLSGPQDGYVAEINSAGSLVYSTYLGGTSSDRVLGITVDSTGLIDVTGSTFSSDFPTKNPVQAFQGSGATADLFVTQINKTSGTLPFSTTYGGTGNDTGRAIAVDSSNLIHVTGETTSADFPSVPGLPPVFGQTSGFVVLFDPVKAAADYSNIFGGSGSTFPTGIVADGNGTFITGSTNSTDFPTTSGTLQTTLSGGFDAFVSQLFPSGNGYVYSTYLGGTGNDNNDGSLFMGGISVNGQAFVTGYTESPDFPVFNPTNGLLPAKRSAFVTKIATGGASLAFSTFLGGSTQSQGWGIAVDTANNNIYVVGDTTDTDFPLVSAAQTTNGGGSDGFVAAYQQPTTNSDIGVTVNPSTTTPVTGTSYSYSISVINNGNNAAGASNVMLFDTLPANVIVNSIFPFQGTCTQPTPQTIACNIGHINIATIVIVSITVTPVAPGTLTNLAVVRSDDNDPTPANNNVTTTITAGFGSCYNPNLGTKGWKGGTAGSPTDFNNATNWDPAGVPTSADNIIVCPGASFQPLATADLAVNNVLMVAGSSLSLGGHTLTAGGTVQASGPISNGTLVTQGSNSTIQGTVPNLSVNTLTVMGGALTVNGNLVVTSQLTLAGFTATVTGAASTINNTGSLNMTNPADHLIVQNGITFNGGSEQFLLTDGVLEIAGGDFTATNNGIANNFAPNTNHTVTFTGSANQNVSFAVPGGNQVFQNLTVNKTGGSLVFQTNAVVQGNALINAGTVSGTTKVTLEGNLADPVGNRWQVASTSILNAFSHVSLPVSGLVTALSFDSAGCVQVDNGFAVTGSLTLNGCMVMNSQSVTVNGQFSTAGSGVLYMVNATEHILVTGDATFNGGDETNILKDGVLEVQGNFIATNNGNANNFRPTVNHTLLLSGGNNQTLSFALPGGNQWINNFTVNKSGGSVTFATNAVINGNVTLVAGAVSGNVTLTLNGNLADSSGTQWQVQNTSIQGSTPQLSNITSNVTFTGTTTLVNAFTVNGSVTVTGALDMGGSTLTVNGNFSTQSLGTLKMTSASDQLIVNGSITFNGGTETGLLTNGILELFGNLTAANNGNPDIFRPSLSHTLLLVGGNNQTLSFALAGNNEWINHLTISKSGGIVSFASNALINGNVQLVSGVVNGNVTVTLNGNLADSVGNQWQVQNTNISGATPSLPGSGLITQLKFTSTSTLPNSFSLTGDLLVTGNLVMNGQSVSVTGNLTTTNPGVLTMQNVNDVLTISGSTTIDGGIQSGLLTAGVINVGGNFVAANNGISTNFNPSGSHRVRFTGATTHTVTFNQPGSQWFNDLEADVFNGQVSFATNVIIAHNAYITNGAIVGNVTATVNGAIFDSTPSSGAWGVQITSMTAPSIIVPTFIQTSLQFPNTSSLATSFTVAGAMTALGNLIINGQTVTVNGAFATSSGGVLTMNNVSDYLLVNGSVVFNGGTETGLLTSGVLETTGTFQATNNGNANNFVASGTHRLRFSGAGNHTVIFGLPGSNQIIQDLEATGGAQMLFNSNAVINGTVYLTSGSAAGASTVTLNGNLVDPVGNQWTVPLLINSPAPVLPVSGIAASVTFGAGTALASSALINGNVQVTGGLSINAQSLSVNGNFTTSSSGVLAMQSATDVLNVSGNVTFNGGAETNLLTNGILAVGGAFVAANNGNSNNFVAVSPHQTQFVGAANTISLSNPGANQQFGDIAINQNVSLLTSVVASGTLIVNNQTGVAITSASSQSLSVGGVNVTTALTLNGTPLSIGNGSLAQFGLTTFTAMDPTVTQLTIAHDGASAPFSFSNLTFATTPTSGKYVQATNTNPALGQLTINLPNSTPNDGTAFTSVDANSKVNWQAATEPDLVVTVTPAPLSATVGQTINYAINVTNSGATSASNVNLAISYTPFNGGISVTGASCTGGATITCSLGTIASGTNIALNAAVTSVDAIVITVNAVATLTETDANPANNTGSSSAAFSAISNPPMGSVNGIITYSRADTGAGTVWQAAGDGSSDTLLFTGNWPRPSPDQQYIAYHCCANPPNYQGGAYVYDVSNATDIQIFSNNDYQNGYTFTPDDSQVYLDYSCGEYKVNRDGTGFTTVFQVDCYDDNPRFNPAGTKLAFENAHAGIGLFNPDGTGRSFIPNTAPNDYMPAWSPDGSRLAFARFVTNGANNVFVINPDGSNLTRLSFFTVANDGPAYGSIAWTPDGSAVVFAGNVNGVPGLYAISTDGQGTLVQLPISNGNSPNWVGDVAPPANTADIALTSSVAATSTVGNNLPLALSITNNGPAVATGVQLSITLPAGSSFVSGYDDQSFAIPLSCSADGQTVTCNVLAPLAPTLSLPIQINVAVQSTGTLAFSAVLSSSSPDSNPNNNSATSTTQAGTAACVQPPGGIISWYRGEGNYSDYLGAHDGAPVASPTFVPGKVGTAFSLDGSASFVDLTAVSGLWTPGPQWTVEAWINPNTTDLSRHTVVGAVNNNIDWGIVYQNGQFGTVISPLGGGATATVFSNYPADLNQFAHVVATDDGANASLYVNGQFLGSLPVQPNYVGDNEPRIGNRSGSLNEFFSGAVDEATIYNRSLTAAEVLGLYNAGSAGKCVGSGAQADISISAAAAPIVVNGNPTYSVTVINNGPALATGVTLTDTLDNFGFVSVTSTQGSCSYNGINVSCALGSLGINATATVSVSITAPSQGWAAHQFSASADQPDGNPLNNLARIGPSDSSFNTAVGANVSVQAADSTGDSAQVTFANVSRKGTTSLQAISAMAPPAGFRHANPPAIFDVATTATASGNIQLAFAFNPAAFHHPAKARLFHMENGVWVDRTTAVDITAKRITGATVSLSPFAIFEPLNNPPVANPGADRFASGNLPTGSSVTLNGSASNDADGDTLTYRWTGPFPEGNGTVTGARPTVTLPFGSSKISLTVNDGEVDSPAVASNITVTDFKLTAVSNNPVAKTGQPASYTIDLAPQLGTFDAAINLSCTGLPAGGSCSFASPVVTPGASSTSVALTISKGTSAAKLTHRPIFAFWLALPFGAVLLGTATSRRRRLVLLSVALALLVIMLACGGGGSGSSFTSPPPPQTTTTTITISGSSGTLTHATTVQLTVGN